MKKYLILISFLTLTLPSALKAETTLPDTPFFLPGSWFGSDIFNPEMHIIPDQNPATGMIATRWMDGLTTTNIASYKIIANLDVLTILLVETASTTTHPNRRTFEYWTFAYNSDKDRGLGMNQRQYGILKMSKKEFDDYSPPPKMTLTEAVDFIKAKTDETIMWGEMHYSYLGDREVENAFLKAHPLPPQSIKPH